VLGSDIKKLEYKNIGQHQGFDDVVEYPLVGIEADVKIAYSRPIGNGEATIIFPLQLVAEDIAGLSDATRAELVSVCETKLKATIA